MEEKYILWERFKSKVPDNLRKIQLILGAAAASFGSIATITFPGKLAIINVIAGYLASACGGMTFLLQFAVQTEKIIAPKDEVKTIEIPVENTDDTVNL